MTILIAARGWAIVPDGTSAAIPGNDLAAVAPLRLRNMTRETHSWKPHGQASGRLPILFIHGLLHGAWCWSTSWCEFFDRRGLAVHLLNLPGHGGTAAAARGLRWTSLADYADTVVEAAAGFDAPPILVGHSLGALLIQMRLHRLKAAAVVLLAPTHPIAMRWVMWQQFRRDPRRFMRAHRVGSPRLAISTPQACRELFFCAVTPERIVARCFALLEEESYLACMELLLRPTVVWRRRASTPVLVLAAGEDGTVPRRVSQGVASLYGVRAEFFDGMGHDLMLEPGWQRVAERLTGWLRGLGLGPLLE